MINFTLLRDLLVVASVSSTICVAFIQKIKKHISCSKCIPYYSFVINIVIAILFCMSFTSIEFPQSLWIGFFSYIGADTLYKTLEGKLARHTDLITKPDNSSKEEGVKEELEEIKYE